MGKDENQESKEINDTETRTDDESAGLTGAEAYEEIREIFSELREIRNTKQFLEAQNRQFGEKIEYLGSELDGMDIVISSHKKEIEFTDQRVRECYKNVQGLKGGQEQVIEAVNHIKKNLKTVTEDNNKCLILKAHLKVEFDSICDEKSLLLKKLKDIEDGIKTISGENALKIPFLMEYDALFKRACLNFKEVENRMDVYLKLLH